MPCLSRRYSSALNLLSMELSIEPPQHNQGRPPLSGRRSPAFSTQVQSEHGPTDHLTCAINITSHDFYKYTSEGTWPVTFAHFESRRVKSEPVGKSLKVRSSEETHELEEGLSQG